MLPPDTDQNCNDQKIDIGLEIDRKKACNIDIQFNSLSYSTKTCSKCMMLIPLFRNETTFDSRLEQKSMS